MLDNIEKELIMFTVFTFVILYNNKKRPMSTKSHRERVHEETQAEILETAWRQIADQGAPALSLRQIAKEMGMTAPALYRYYESRDALVTALIVDAYTSLGAALEKARKEAKASAAAGRIRSVGMVYRDWALGHPQRYALIFGTPIPGYQAPMEITQPAAAGAMQPLVAELLAAHQSGETHFAEAGMALSPSLKEQFAGWGKSMDLDLPAELLYAALLAWSRIHGIVSLELDHHFESMIGEADNFFRSELDNLLRLLGIPTG